MKPQDTKIFLHEVCIIGYNDFDRKSFKTTNQMKRFFNKRSNNLYN